MAKGVSSLAKRRSGEGSGSLADMMGGLLGASPGVVAGSGAGGVIGGLGGLFDELAGMRTAAPRTNAPDLAGLLGQLGGAKSTGGLGDLAGVLAGAGSVGGVGAFMGGMLAGDGGLGATLNSAFANGGEPAMPPAPEQELAAAVLLKAMIQAAKCDGQIDAGEQGKLMQALGDIDAEEKAFVQAELAAPIDTEALVKLIPEGLEAQAYTVSLMAIDLDNQTEAQYLHGLASALNLQPAEVNQIHERLGVAKLYA